MALQQIKGNYWEAFQVNNKDFDFLYNHLLEIETPQTTEELLLAIINNRIQKEKEELLAKTQGSGTVYMPKKTFQEGEKVVFPTMEWRSGVVKEVRDGFNPEYPNLKVIKVAFDDKETHEYASNIQTHTLNTPIDLIGNDKNYDQNFVLSTYKEKLFAEIDQSLSDNEELVRIAGAWFPSALLVDINIGMLNLAEAVLEEAKGGPLKTSELLKQVELESDANQKLVEFSFNLAMQNDERFDEVGPSGEVIWYLKSAEPESVQKVPPYLQYEAIKFDESAVQPLFEQFEGNVFDELEPNEAVEDTADEITISLIYPHWRAGTLPLSKSLAHLFPTAYEAPRVRFTFVDKEDKNIFNGWVVRPYKYVYGLENWYEEKGLMPGSLVTVKRGKNPGEILVTSHKSRQNKEWLKTVLVGADQGIVFALLKQNIEADFNERMVIAVPDVALLDEIWAKENGKNKFENVVRKCMRELAKMNPQGHIHAQELYAAVNVIFRCPPGPILHLLLIDKGVKHLGDLYFHIKDSEE